jgi:hypothetical protein
MYIAWSYLLQIHLHNPMVSYFGLCCWSSRWLCSHQDRTDIPSQYLHKSHRNYSSYPNCFSLYLCILSWRHFCLWNQSIGTCRLWITLSHRLVSCYWMASLFMQYKSRWNSEYHSLVAHLVTIRSTQLCSLSGSCHYYIHHRIKSSNAHLLSATCCHQQIRFKSLFHLCYSHCCSHLLWNTFFCTWKEIFETIDWFLNK